VFTYMTPTSIVYVKLVRLEFFFSKRTSLVNLYYNLNCGVIFNILNAVIVLILNKKVFTTISELNKLIFNVIFV